MNQAVSPEPPVTQATERVRVMTLRRALGADWRHYRVVCMVAFARAAAISGCLDTCLCAQSSGEPIGRVVQWQDAALAVGGDDRGSGSADGCGCFYASGSFGH